MFHDPRREVQIRRKVYSPNFLSVRYWKQLQVKSKIIIFCNKKKITGDLIRKKCFSYVNSHFGKILKYIKKTLVYQPILKN